MIPTARCFAQGPAGFFKKSADELARYTKMAWNLETLSVPHKPYHLLDFEDPSTVTACKTMADRAVGGFSTADLDFVPADPNTNTPAHARFHGSISTKLPANWKVQRTGYAAFRSHDRGYWLFGRLYWDVDPYAYLALRVKSDGRRYKVNIQTDSIVESDIHQHRLFTKHHRIPRDRRVAVEEQFASSVENVGVGDGEGRVGDGRVPRALADFAPEEVEGEREGEGVRGEEGEVFSHTTRESSNPDSTGWETILIPWNSFVRTNLGVAVEPQTSLIRQRIKSIGIGLTDRVEGPYDLRIHRMWATNGLSEEEMEEERRICGVDAGRVVGRETGVLEEEPLVVEEEEGGLERFRNVGKKDGKGEGE